MTLAVLVAVLAGVAVGGLGGSLLQRRSVARQLRARLQDRGAGSVNGGISGQLLALDGLFERLGTQHRAATDQAVQGRMRALLDGFPAAVLVYDRYDKLSEANTLGEQLLAGRHVEPLVVGAARELLEELRRHDQPGRRATRRLTVSGPPRRSYDLSVRRLSAEETLVVVEDITERRRLEEVRRDFVANISHELKTPLGAMAVLAETMLFADVDERTGELAVPAQLAERLHREALRMGSTIDDLLLLSRIEADEEPRLDPVPLLPVVREALSQVTQAAAAAGITIVTDVCAQLSVPADRRQLVSAIYNLLDNAVKYSDRGQTVTVRASARPEEVAVQVADAGIGIPGRDLERVFERFYRVDPARSRRTGGTGLGLAIVRHVAHNHGGSITVTSIEGEGSTFTLTLPSVPAPPGDQPADRPGDGAG